MREAEGLSRGKIREPGHAPIAADKSGPGDSETLNSKPMSMAWHFWWRALCTSHVSRIGFFEMKTVPVAGKPSSSAGLGSPAQGEVHVWRIELDCAPSAFGRIEAMLSSNERERAERFKFEELKSSLDCGTRGYADYSGPICRS